MLPHASEQKLKRKNKQTKILAPDSRMQVTAIKFLGVGGENSWTTKIVSPGVQSLLVTRYTLSIKVSSPWSSYHCMCVKCSHNQLLHWDTTLALGVSVSHCKGIEKVSNELLFIYFCFIFYWIPYAISQIFFLRI